MSPPRRVVINLDEEGRSCVAADGPSPTTFDMGPVAMHQLWLTTETPAEPGRDRLAEHPPPFPLAQPAAGGTLFQICTFQPHTESPRHKTRTVDYVVVTAGQIDMQTEDGALVTLAAGDCLVQCETIHRWVNSYDEPCTLAVTCLSTSDDPSASLDIELASDADR